MSLARIEVHHPGPFPSSLVGIDPEDGNEDEGKELAESWFYVHRERRRTIPAYLIAAVLAVTYGRKCFPADLMTAAFEIEMQIESKRVSKELCLMIGSINLRCY